MAVDRRDEWMQVTRRGRVRVFAIYDHPRDYPDCFVVRAMETAGDIPPWCVVFMMEAKFADTLEAARGLLPGGLVKVGPSPGDDPVIAEVWM